MRRSLPVLATLSAALLLPTVMASSASAATTRGTDARGDVRYFDGDSDVEDDPGVVTPRPTVDVTSFRVAYSGSRIQVFVQYDDLRTKSFTTFYSGLILTYPRSGGRTADAELQVVTSPDRRRGTSSLSGEYAREGCATQHKIDYAADTIVISAPSSCLGNPRYVDAFVGTFEATANFSKYYIDVAPGGADDSISDPKTVRVRRG